MADSARRSRAVAEGEAEDSREFGELASLAGIWKCRDCGGQIQIIVAPDTALDQPFICMCGAPMVPGEERSESARGEAP